MLELFATTFVAGLLYMFIPGPATLAALSLSAVPELRACATFLICHLLVIWLGRPLQSQPLLAYRKLIFCSLMFWDLPVVFTLFGLG